MNLLERGDIEIVGRVESSNATLIVQLTLGEESCWGVFKPEVGEQWLEDFPAGLWKRERAAYLLSEWLGWSVVPPTVVREVELPGGGSLGVGSLQLYVDNDGSHYFPLYETRPDLHEQFFRMAVFDLLANNTDRKSGHVLLEVAGEGGEADHVWGIDQGLCFHADPKLRTVIWEFAGADIPIEWVDAVAPLVDAVPDEIAALLTPAEVEALQSRASRIVRLPYLPSPRSQWQYPWPLV